MVVEMFQVNLPEHLSSSERMVWYREMLVACLLDLRYIVLLYGLWFALVGLGYTVPFREWVAKPVVFSLLCMPLFMGLSPTVLRGIGLDAYKGVHRGVFVAVLVGLVSAFLDWLLFSSKTDTGLVEGKSILILMGIVSFSLGLAWVRDARHLGVQGLYFPVAFFCCWWGTYAITWCSILFWRYL